MVAETNEAGVPDPGPPRRRAGTPAAQPGSIRRLCAAVIVLCAVAIRAQAEPATIAGPVVRGEVGRRLHDWLTRATAFGLHGSVLVEQAGEVVLLAGYGMADRSTRRPITGRTRFDIGSLGKQFTAAAVAEQVRLGRLTWQSKLGDLLLGVPSDKRGITVHQLLTHTAGLPYQRASDKLLEAPLASEPGARFSYSNVGYAILGQVVEATSQRSLQDVTRELFQRASLVDVAFTGSATAWDDLAHGYVDGFDVGTPDHLAFDERYRGAGGHACTVSELHRWVHALEDGEVLPPEIVERMLTNHAPGAVGYGYGWFILRTTRGTPLYRHMGTYYGFNSELRRYRGEGRTIVFLSNTFARGRALRDAVVNQLGLMLAGDDVPEPPTTVAIDPAQAGKRHGVYRATDAVEFTVDSDAGALFVSSQQQAGLNALFGVVGDERAEELIASCRHRSLALASALRRDARPEVETLVNPGWLGAYTDLSSAWTRLHQQCTTIDDVTVRGTAVHDAAAGIAVSVVEVSGSGGRAALELVWTRNGTLGARSVGSMPGRNMLPTGDGAYAAFDLFTGLTVWCSFELGESGSIALELRRGDVVVRAERI